MKCNELVQVKQISPCSLLLTTFCLEHTPSTVACVCIHLSCRWKGLDIPQSSDGKNWWEYIDPNINQIKLDGKYQSVDSIIYNPTLLDL